MVPSRTNSTRRFARSRRPKAQLAARTFGGVVRRLEQMLDLLVEPERGQLEGLLVRRDKLAVQMDGVVWAHRQSWAFCRLNPQERRLLLRALVLIEHDALEDGR